MRFLKETQSTGNKFTEDHLPNTAPSNKNILCLGPLWCPKLVSQVNTLSSQCQGHKLDPWVGN